MSLKDTQNFFYHLCTDLEFTCDEATLKKHLPAETVKHWLSYPDYKQMVYRRLVKNNIQSMIENNFELTLSFLDKQTKDKLIASFIHNHKICSNFYRDIPREFFDFVSQHHPLPKDPGFLGHLCDFEYSYSDLLFKPNLKNLPQSNPDAQLLNSIAHLNPHLHLKTYPYPLHKIQKACDPSSIKEHRTHLLIYRHPKSLERSFFVINTNAHHFLQFLIQNPNTPLSQAIENTLSIQAADSTETATQDIMIFLKQLIEKHIILALV